MRTRIILVANLIGVLAVSYALLAQSQESLWGTWHLNLAKAKYDPPVPPPKSNAKKYEPWQGGVKATQDVVTATGEKRHMEVTGKFDGKDNPVVGQSDNDSYAFKKIDDHTYEVTGKKGGKVAQVSKIVVAADGKTRVVTQSGTNAKGEAFHNVLLWDKH